MKQKIVQQAVGGVRAYFRKGEHEEGSDLQALTEVLVRKSYRRVRDQFDVKPGEIWLDLGANIGAFALYCASHGATAVCFEPDPACFEVLKLNAPNYELFNAAVTAFTSDTVSFRTSNNPDNQYRGTVLGGKVRVPQRYVEHAPVSNIYAGDLNGVYDGVKMDIEGSEGPIFDAGLLPRCDKLVLEYHTSRDSSVARLKKRLAFLRKRFHHVKYPKTYDDAIANQLKDYRPRFDHLIFAWGAK